MFLELILERSKSFKKSLRLHLVFFFSFVRVWRQRVDGSDASSLSEIPYLDFTRNRLGLLFLLLLTHSLRQREEVNRYGLPSPPALPAPGYLALKNSHRLSAEKCIAALRSPQVITEPTELLVEETLASAQGAVLLLVMSQWASCGKAILYLGASLWLTMNTLLSEEANNSSLQIRCLS